MADPLHVAGFALILGGIAAFFVVYGLCLVATRPARPRPLPATQDLGGNPEPPAVVSLLTNGWEITEDAAESTFLDLGARKYLEFRQPANDPYQTTVHVKVDSPAGLNRYEQRVFDRIRAIAVGRVVPLTALTFRDPAQAAGFAKRVSAEVIADARARGLSRRRFGPAVIALLTASAAIAGVCASIGAALLIDWKHAAESSDSKHDPRGLIGLGIVVFGVLSVVASRNVGERDTALGREVAARWLGVKAWLQNTEAFGDLPPSAVEVWDRYLAYGAAVGATRVSSAVIDLGMGDRKRVWSSYGDTWHRVRVRYPRVWWRYGRTAPQIIGRAVIAGIIGFVLVRYTGKALATATKQAVVGNSGFSSFADPVRLLLLGFGGLLLLYALYMITRTVIDLAAPHTTTGQVLWEQVHVSTKSSENSPARPLLYHFAIDDGSGDTTRAWILPVTLHRRCQVGDTVKIVARPWSRRVGEVDVVQQGALRQSDAVQTTTDQTENLILSAMGMPVPGQRGRDHGGLATPVPELVTDAEASQAMGLPVHRGSHANAAGGSALVFLDAANQPVLMMGIAPGIAGSMLMRSRARTQAQPLPGIGDEAYTGDGWALARRGDTVIMLAAQGDGRRVPPNNLWWLLQTAVARLAAPATT